MPQSLSNILIHLIYSTKDRHPWLDAEARERLYPYTGGILRNIGCPLLQMGGTEDHVHLLIALSRKVTVAKVVEEAKRSTSKWMKDRHPAFAWQAGYGAFSVSAGDAEGVRKYILNQEEHHKKWSFQDELRGSCARRAWNSTRSTCGIEASVAALQAAREEVSRLFPGRCPSLYPCGPLGRGRSSALR